MNILYFIVLCFIFVPIGYKAFWYLKYSKEQNQPPNKEKQATDDTGSVRPDLNNHPSEQQRIPRQKKNAKCTVYYQKIKARNRIRNRIARKSRQINRK